MSGDRAHPRLDRCRIGHHRHGRTAVSWTDSWTEIADTHRGALTTVTTVQTNRLRALLLGGEDVDRRLARGRLTDAALTAVAPVASPAMPIASTRGTPRSAASLSLSAMAPALATNRAQPQAIVNDLAPGLTDRRGTDPVSAVGRDRGRDPTDPALWSHDLPTDRKIT